MNDYFKQAGDISEKEIGNGFKPAGDIPEHGISNGFKPAGDVSGNEIGKIKEEIDDYLLTIVSGKKYGYESEMGILVGGASVIVSLDKLKEMVDEGYNIVKAQCINIEPSMISVEYQCFKKVDSERRGRF